MKLIAIHNNTANTLALVNTTDNLNLDGIKYTVITNENKNKLFTHDELTDFTNKLVTVVQDFMKNE